MNNKDYEQLVKKYKPKEPKLKNSLVAFGVGGALGFLAELIFNMLTYYFHLSKDVGSAWTLLIFIFAACILTCFHVFDNFVQKIQAGLIVPITGFAHSVCSSALEYKKDGLITGLGSNMFKLAGSVLLYGILSAFILSMIKVVLYG